MLRGSAPEPPPDPRMFVMVTLAGFYRCDRSTSGLPVGKVSRGLVAL
jgi:hypothetical protein